jgi:hypothetical protein
MARITLLDVAKLNNTDKVVGLIEESVLFTPELDLFPARSVRGTSFYTVKRTGLPTAGFRKANAGVTPSKSTFAKQLVECFILSSAVQVDKAVAQAFEDGPGALEMIEAAGVMKAAMRTVGTQIWYGISADAAGFGGVKAFTPFSGAMTVNSGGSDALVQSSVYAVKFGAQDAQLILGNGATFDLTPFRDENFLDADSLPVPGRVADLTAWIGLAINNANCVGRLCNVGADTETGDLCTDAKLQQLLDKFPSGYKPDAFFMSRRSRSQLQRSRTVVLLGQGTQRVNQPGIAAVPTEYDGIPIVATDSILNTDAVES